MGKFKHKVALVGLAVALLMGSGMAYTVPAYAVAKYRTWLDNSYTFLAGQQPFFRGWGTVNGMPTFMLESLRTQTTGLTDTILFDKVIACPFICASAATMTATVRVFRDYGNSTPAAMKSPSVDGDSMWFEFPPYAQGFVITYAAADTPAYFILGGYAIPTPNPVR